MSDTINSKKILIIGSGPIVIGQAAEFDYSGAQASLAAREEGYETILVNSNPATIQTDHEIADKVYIEPLTSEFLEKIIAKEQPFGLLATVGGQTGLNLGKELYEKGILEKYGVEFLGTDIEAIKLGEDRGEFKQLCIEIGEPVLPSKFIDNIQEGLDFAEKTGFPIIIRSAYTLGGTGSSTAYNMEDYRVKLREGIDLSPVKQVLVEKSVLGTAELEYEMIRDSAGNKLMICNMENIDPMGVHTGESMVVAPSQTLDDRDHQKLRTSAFRIIEALNIQGGCNVQFALDQRTGEYYIIEVNPRLSRSSALASKATGYPIARVATKIALGKTLPEITNNITGKSAFFEPALDYTVIKIPRWPDDKFPTMDKSIGVTMKSTGEVMSIGRTFEESMYKAISSLDTKRNIYECLNHLDKDTLRPYLTNANTQRLSAIFAAFNMGYGDEKLVSRTGINRWFISKLRDLYNNRETISSAINVYKMVDTCAGEFEAKTPYFYSCQGYENEAKPLEGKKVIILGSGPIRIGQGIEFDYMTVHAVKALQKRGIKVIIINNNPETVSTDYSTSDRLYFEPLTLEFVSKIVKNEKEGLLGVIAQFGGQTAINLAGALEIMGVKVLGSSAEVIELAEDREKTGDIIQELGYEMPTWDIAMSKTEVLQKCEKIGYPLLLRPSFVLGGEGMIIANEQEDVASYLGLMNEEKFRKPLLIDKFLENSVEVDVDFLSDGENVETFVLEQLDPAGIHSGDSRCVYPAQTIKPEVKKELKEIARKVALRLGIVGVGNLQCAIKGDKISIIEINPRASRTLPFVSKCIGVSLAQIGTNLIMGDKLPDIKHDSKGLLAIKAPIFSTHKLVGVSNDLGPLMKSTGESMSVGKTMEEALAKVEGRIIDSTEIYTL